MSTRHDPDLDLERLLDDDRGDFGAIYKRLARNEPPRRLDRTVLAEAARAVHSGRPPRSQRWLLGLGSAAGIVMAAGIAWQVGRQIDSRDAAMSPATQAPRASQVITVLPISELPAPSPAAAAETTAEAAPEEKPKPVPEVMARPRKAVPVPAPVAAPAPPAPPPPAQEAPLIERETADAVQESATSAARSDAQDQARNTAGSVAEPATADTLQKRSSQAAREEAMPTRAPAPSTSVQLRRNMRLAPQDWLAEISRLKKEGHRQQAIENLLLFRRMHPDWVLSDDLRKLAE